MANTELTNLTNPTENLLPNPELAGRRQGVVPLDWTISNTNGTVVSILGQGPDDGGGHPYIDLLMGGVATSNVANVQINFNLGNTTPISANAGDSMIASM